MKTLFYLIGGMVWSLSSNAQLQNLDFENWEEPISPNNFSNIPTGWIWTDGLVINSTYNFHYAPATNAHQNNHALLLSVWYNHTKDAAIQKAPISERPGALSGWYQYTQNIIGGGFSGTLQKDTAMISVYLTKHNHTTHLNDTIGKGVLEIGDSTEVYTGFLVEINYTSAETPDSITVILDPSLVKRYPNRPGYSIGDNGVTSFFLVDNLSLLNGTAKINELNKSELSIYPNPAETTFQISGLEKLAGIKALQVFDLHGKQISSPSIASSSIDVSVLESGIYQLKVIHENGVEMIRFVKE